MSEELDAKALLRLVAEHATQKQLKGLLAKAARALEPSEQAQKLRVAFAGLNDPHEFAVGQLVTWKPGLKNRKRPGEKEPAIVIQVLEEPLFDTNVDDSGASTPYFREPLDLVLGVLDDDGDFHIFHYDSRLFAPFSPDDTSDAE